MEFHFIILFIALTSVAVTSKYIRPTNLYPLLKGLPICFLIIWVFDSQNYQSEFYLKAILIGLCFSLIGDFLLIFPSQFKSGLFVFLTGHIWYIMGFLSSEWLLPFVPTIVILILSISMITQLYPKAGKLKIPVVIYIAVIGAMGFSAFGRFEAFQSTHTMLGAVGATLFMISDGVLGWNKFKNKFPLAEAIILITYYFGQWMIALSTLY